MKSKLLFASLLSLLFFLSVNATFAQDKVGVPPFRKGEIVVAGAPDTFSADVKVIKYHPNANLSVLAVTRGEEFGQVQKYREKGRRAGLNYIAEASVNDPLYSLQWHFPLIQSDDAWTVSTGHDVIVAVLDTGLVTGGPDGIELVKPGINILDTTLEPLDGNGHGTHVSGTIAQRTNNGVGVAGLAYDATIMPVKVLDDKGRGSFADIAEGIRWAVDNGADVINMSLGISAIYNVTNDSIVDPELVYAYSKNVTVVCAAGNDGWGENVSYPAISDQTIAVGATGYDGTIVNYSNFGKGLDIMAPGGDMYVDLNGDGNGDGILQETISSSRKEYSWDYYFFNGTSMAAPHVSAVAALLISQERAKGVEMTSQEVYDRMTSTTLDLNTEGYDSLTGYGLVQAYDALASEGTCDEDGDGYCVDEGDCDDSDSAINSGAEEICGDGIDNDCNVATSDECPTCGEKKSPCNSNDECCSGACNTRVGWCK